MNALIEGDRGGAPILGAQEKGGKQRWLVVLVDGNRSGTEAADINGPMATGLWLP